MPGPTSFMRYFVLGLIALIAAAGCGDVTKESPPPTGALGVSIANLSSVPGVATVELTATGPENFTHVFVPNAPQAWTYLRTALPPGSYTLSAVARDALDVVLYETGTVIATVNAGVTAQAVLVLHPSVPVDGVNNHAPRFLAITTNAATILPGTDLVIDFQVADLEGDTMELVGADACAIPPCSPGAFNPNPVLFTNTTPNAAQNGTMTWTAPNVSGLYTLRFVLTDERSAASDFSIQVPVGEVTGDIEIDFRINMAPVVSAIAVTPLESGEVDLVATISDDYTAPAAMTYVWSTDPTTCTGTFSVAAAATTFTLASFAPGSDLCNLTLEVEDADEGVNVSQIFLNEDLVAVTAPPGLRSLFQTQIDAIAGDVVEFGVEAALFGIDVGAVPTFTWTHPGTLATTLQTDAGTTSELSWTATAGELTCVGTTATFSVTATVNGRTSAPVAFDVSVAPSLCL